MSLVLTRTKGTTDNGFKAEQSTTESISVRRPRINLRRCSMIGLETEKLFIHDRHWCRRSNSLTKLYELMWSGTLNVIKPIEFLWYGHCQRPKPSEFRPAVKKHFAHTGSLSSNTGLADSHGSRLKPQTDTKHIFENCSREADLDAAN